VRKDRRNTQQQWMRKLFGVIATNSSKNSIRRHQAVAQPQTADRRLQHLKSHTTANTRAKLAKHVLRKVLPT
jgi:hypothetical protein